MSADAGLTPQSFADSFKCNRCLRQPVAVRTLLDSRTGQSVRMFECECRERNWHELPKDRSGIAGDGKRDR